MSNTFIFALWALIIYVAVYTIVDRICKCVEHCATVKSFIECAKDPEKLNEIIEAIK